MNTLAMQIRMAEKRLRLGQAACDQKGRDLRQRLRDALGLPALLLAGAKIY